MLRELTTSNKVNMIRTSIVARMAYLAFADFTLIIVLIAHLKSLTVLHKHLALTIRNIIASNNLIVSFDHIWSHTSTLAFLARFLL